MPPLPGYNFLRGRAKVQFLEFFNRRFHDPEPTYMSILNFLRHLRRKDRLPHQCVVVEGFAALYRHVPEEEWGELTELIHKTLLRAANRLQNTNAYVCFTVPLDVQFQPARHVSLRLPDRRLVSLYDVFGSVSEQSSDHYHSGFNIAS